MLRYVPSDKELLKKRAKFPDLESTLINCIQKERNIGRAVTSFQIKSQAEKILKNDGNDESIDFKASNGWLERFLNILGMSLFYRIFIFNHRFFKTEIFV